MAPRNIAPVGITRLGGTPEDQIAALRQSVEIAVSNIGRIRSDIQALDERISPYIHTKPARDLKNINDDHDARYLLKHHGITPGFVIYADSQTTLAASPIEILDAENLDIHDYRIKSLLDPLDDQDAATKIYVDDAVTEVVYHPDAVITEAGTYVSGDANSVHDISDGDVYYVDEVGGVPGYSIVFDFSDIDRINRIWLHLKYSGLVSHTVNVELWNYNTTAWDTFTSFTTTADLQYIDFPITDYADYVNAGAARLRVYHISSGLPTHHIEIDYAALAKAGFGASTDHGSLTGLNDDDHSGSNGYLRTDGGRALSGNWDAGGYDITMGGSLIVNSGVIKCDSASSLVINYTGASPGSIEIGKGSTAGSKVDLWLGSILALRVNANGIINIGGNAGSAQSSDYPMLYRTSNTGSGIFSTAGNLVIQPRTSATRDVYVLASNGNPIAKLGSTNYATTLYGTLLVTNIPAYGSGASIFLTSNGGTISSRTAAQVLSDIGAAPLVHGVDQFYLPYSDAAGKNSWAKSTISTNGSTLTQVAGALSVSSIAHLTATNSYILTWYNDGGQPYITYRSPAEIWSDIGGPTHTHNHGVTTYVMPYATGATTWGNSPLSTNGSAGSGGIITIDSTLWLQYINARSTAATVFLTQGDGTNTYAIASRSSAQVLSDIGAAPLTHGVSAGYIGYAPTTTTWANSPLYVDGGATKTAADIEFTSDAVGPILIYSGNRYRLKVAAGPTLYLDGPL